MKVAIVGAGISGLALAAALHREGLDVTVYEKSPTVRGGGSGITLAPNALAALDSSESVRLFVNVSASRGRFKAGSAALEVRGSCVFLPTSPLSLS